LPITVGAGLETVAARPLAKRAPPTPPLSTVTKGLE
jgi:hypothetical protein